MSLFSRQANIPGIIIPDTVIFSAFAEGYTDLTNPHIYRVNAVLRSIALVGVKNLFCTFQDDGLTRIWMDPIHGFRPYMNFRSIVQPDENTAIPGCDERDEDGFYVILHVKGEEWTHPLYNMPGIMWLHTDKNDYVLISNDARAFKAMAETFNPDEGEGFRPEVYNNRNEVTAAVIMQIMCYEECIFEDQTAIRISDMYDQVCETMHNEVRNAEKIAKRKSKELGACNEDEEALEREIAAMEAQNAPEVVQDADVLAAETEAEDEPVEETDDEVETETAEEEE